MQDEKTTQLQKQAKSVIWVEGTVDKHIPLSHTGMEFKGCRTPRQDPNHLNRKTLLGGHRDFQRPPSSGSSLPGPSPPTPRVAALRDAPPSSADPRQSTRALATSKPRFFLPCSIPRGGCEMGSPAAGKGPSRGWGLPPTTTPPLCPEARRGLCGGSSARRPAQR